MKYTKSRDGIERITLVARKRVTRIERHDLAMLAKRRGQTLQEFLFCALEDGIIREQELDDAEDGDTEPRAASSGVE